MSTEISVSLGRDVREFARRDGNRNRENSCSILNSAGIGNGSADRRSCIIEGAKVWS